MSKSSNHFSEQWVQWLAAAGVVVFVGSILWSMWAETLWPLIQAGDTVAVARHAAGLPLLLGGVGVFAWGGLGFARATATLTEDDTFQTQQTQLRDEATPPDQRATLKRAQWQLLGRRWRPSLGRVAVGFALIVIGSAIINW